MKRAQSSQVRFRQKSETYSTVNNPLDKQNVDNIFKVTLSRVLVVPRVKFCGLFPSFIFVSVYLRVHLKYFVIRLAYKMFVEKNH